MEFQNELIMFSTHDNINNDINFSERVLSNYLEDDTTLTTGGMATDGNGCPHIDTRNVPL